MAKKQRAQLDAERDARLEAAHRGERPYRRDGRSETSRANLGSHVPARLSDDETVILSVRLSRRERDRLDREAAANGNTLSQHVRALLTDGYEGDPIRLER